MDYASVATLKQQGLRMPGAFTVGIEEEYQIIDPNSGELRSYVSQILEEGRLILREQLKPEMMQSVVEVGTHVASEPADCAIGPLAVVLARAEMMKHQESNRRLQGGVVRK